MGTTIKIIAIPIKPATPISFHSKQATMNESNGANHIEFKHRDTHSKRFTSFDNKLTTLPGDVSPNAFCDKRRAFKLPKKKESFNFNSISKRQHQFIECFMKLKWNFYLTINKAANTDSHFHSVMKAHHPKLIRAECVH